MDERAPEGSGKRTRPALWVGAALVALGSLVGIQYLSKLASDATPSVWLAMMRRQMPDSMCKSGGFLRTCFQATEDECRGFWADASVPPSGARGKKPGSSSLTPSVSIQASGSSSRQARREGRHHMSLTDHRSRLIDLHAHR
jgi:hypothetical protein